MRIATWNVNSVVARKERLLRWLRRYEPDVLGLQELKALDDKFPHAEVDALGYHALTHGQRAYNGVALISRHGLEDVRLGFRDGEDEPDARVMSARVRGARVITVYVPNGQAVGSEKYHYKLAWLDRLLAMLKREHHPGEPLILCGDFNCAPDDRDANPAGEHFKGVLTDPEVRSRVQALCDWGLEDVFRRHHQDGGRYSWWDYRMLGFAKNNGMRIDFVLATSAMGSTDAWMDRDERKGKKPSDHVPVVGEFRPPE